MKINTRLWLPIGAIAVMAALVELYVPNMTPQGELRSTSASQEEFRVTPSPRRNAASALRHGDEIFDHPDYRLRVYYDINDNAFEMAFSERDPSTGGWYHSGVWFTTSYKLKYIAPQPNGDLFAIGINQGDQVVVERFDFGIGEGAYRVTLTEYSANTIGQSLPMTELGLEIVGSGFKIPGKDRNPRWLSVVRTLIYIGNDLDGVLGGEADPEGRFVLVMDQEKDVYQIPTERGAFPSLVVNKSSTQAMPRANGMIGIFRHLIHNRVYMMHTASRAKTRVMLIDANNDGVFESPIEYEPEYKHFSPTPQTFEEGLMHFYRSTTL